MCCLSAAGQGKWSGTGELHASLLAGQIGNVRKTHGVQFGAVWEAPHPADPCRSNALLPGV